MLRLGDSGLEVDRLQRELTYLGWLDGTPDGNYDQMTAQAVTAFQRYYALQIDGIAGPETLGTLKRILFIAALRPHVEHIERAHGLPAAAVLAQACLESNFGESAPGNNLFGIKWTGTGDCVERRTWEYRDGKKVRVQAKFRTYESTVDSLRDYAALILDASRYAAAREWPTCPIAYVYWVWRAGYATDIAYVDKVLGIMRKYRLLDCTEPGPDIEAVKSELRDIQESAHNCLALLSGMKGGAVDGL